VGVLALVAVGSGDPLSVVERVSCSFQLPGIRGGRAKTCVKPRERRVLAR
jgi:hypothetical protein